MASPIIHQDLSGLPQGISMLGNAISQAMTQRFQNQAQRKQGSILENTLGALPANASPMTVMQAMSNAIKQGVAPQLAKEAATLYGTLAKNNRPGLLTQFLIENGLISGQDGQQMSNVPENGQTQPQINQSGGSILSNIVGKPVRPSIADTPFAGLSDEQVVLMSANQDPELSAIGQSVQVARDAADKRYAADRNYASQRTKKFDEEITNLRRGSASQGIALNEIKFGLNNQDPKKATSDWWASHLSKWTEPLVSAEGNLIQSGVKHYLISDLSSVKGRPNQFLEGLLLASLPGLGKSNLSNQALVAGLEMRQAADELKIQITDELVSRYEGPNGMGIIPANLERLVHEQMKPIMEDLSNKHAYQLRTIQEEEQGIENLAKKKVVQGTPLTLKMMTYLADEYGKENAIKRALQLGYTILTEEETKRYSNANQ